MQYVKDADHFEILDYAHRRTRELFAQIADALGWNYMCVFNDGERVFLDGGPYLTHIVPIDPVFFSIYPLKSHMDVLIEIVRSCGGIKE